MKENKFTLWLFNFLHKTRIKEVTNVSYEGVYSTYYQAQYRSFVICPYTWQEIYKDVNFSGKVLGEYRKPNTLDYEKLRIDQWLDSKRKDFFTTTKVKYIKYP